MKTKCMSCGGTTTKMQAGGLPKAQKGVMVKPIIKPIKKFVKKITRPTRPKMELGGSLPKAQNG